MILAREIFRYFKANGFSEPAMRHFDAGLLAQVAKRGDLNWPRRVRHWAKGKRVLDIGCGRNYQGYGFLAVGAKAYTGLDPTLDLDDDRVKDSRSHWGKFEKGGLSPRMLMARFPELQFATCSVEDFQPKERFDLIVMHNVTEHLMQIDQVFANFPAFLNPGGRIVFRHPNYYCWHGHHMKPRTIYEIQPNDPQQQLVLDWAHVDFDPVKHAWIGRTQNRIRLAALRQLVEKYFVIETWEEQESQKKDGIGRLTDEIVARHPGFTRRELATRAVFVVGKVR